MHIRAPAEMTLRARFSFCKYYTVAEFSCFFLRNLVTTPFRNSDVRLRVCVYVSSCTIPTMPFFDVRHFLLFSMVRISGSLTIKVLQKIYTQNNVHITHR